MRKLMFTLSCINAVLNTLVIAIFMPHDVIMLYNISGTAVAYGSRWTYLLYVAIPVLISAVLLIVEKVTKKEAQSEDNNKSDDESLNALDEILTGNTPHNENIAMIFIWFFAIISWVMTGIALNNIENISVIMPSIIVIMLSAAAIFMTGLNGGSSSSTLCGIHLKWLDNNEIKGKLANRFSMYMGMLSGMVGVCLSAWSLVISNNIPNCIAVVQLLLAAFVLPIAYSYNICRKN